jgi:hypothetical protein
MQALNIGKYLATKSQDMNREDSQSEDYPHWKTVVRARLRRTKQKRVIVLENEDFFTAVGSSIRIISKVL